MNRRNPWNYRFLLYLGEDIVNAHVGAFNEAGFFGLGHLHGGYAGQATVIAVSYGVGKAITGTAAPPAAGAAQKSAARPAGSLPAGRYRVTVQPSATQGTGSITNQLTRAQQRNVRTLDNVVRNNLTPNDFSGTLRDLQGNPVPRPGGGFWDHRTEMVQSHNSLQGVRRGLEGSLNNPNLDPAVRTFLQGELNRANTYINMIDDLFSPFGGVR